MTRRFVVLVDAVTIKAGYFRLGDVVTDRVLGPEAEKLVILGAIREDDFHLSALPDDASRD